MTRSTLFDRLNQELSEFGKKAQAALDEGKLQIELLRIPAQAGQRGARPRAADSPPRAGRGGRSRGGWTPCCCGWTIWRRRSAGWRDRSPKPGGSGRRVRSPRSAAGRHRRAGTYPRLRPDAAQVRSDFLHPGRDRDPDPVGIVAAEPVHSQARHPLQVADLVHGPGDDREAGVVNPADQLPVHLLPLLPQRRGADAAHRRHRIVEVGRQQDAPAQLRAAASQTPHDPVVEAVHRVARRAPDPGRAPRAARRRAPRAGS